ncbi:MAG: cell division protein FtsH, partial [Lachnospiraceae bacterium]|nr:cell division protein FtsH [Lachnospiraceae bacterium]
MNKSGKSIYLYFVIIFCLLMFTVWIGTLRVPNSSYTRGEFERQMENNEVAVVTICPNKDTPAGSLEVILKNGEERVLYVTDVTQMESIVRKHGIDCSVESVPEESWFLNSVLPILIVVVFCVFFFVIMNSQNSGGGGKMMNFGKSRARLTMGAENKITLEEVAGLKEEKEELQEIVEFLKEPGKFTKVGARIPKG